MQTQRKRRRMHCCKLNLEASHGGDGVEEHDDAEPPGAVRVGRVDDGAGRDDEDVALLDAERLPLPPVEQRDDALALLDEHDLVGVVVAGLQERARRGLQLGDAVVADGVLEQLVREPLQHPEPPLPGARPVPEALLAVVVRPAGAGALLPVRVGREREGGAQGEQEHQHQR
jgi:hypothetical protein